MSSSIRVLAGTAAVAILAVACTAARPVPPPPTARPASTVMTTPRPPDTRAEKIADTLFGVSVPDPYRWLEAAEAPEVKSWMDAQDQFARERLEALPGRDAIRARLKQLYYVDSMSPPRHRGDRWFYMRQHADKEKGILYVREGGGDDAGTERALIDPNTLSPDGSIALGRWVPSWDGKWLAYQLKPNNADEATLYVMDVATGRNTAIDVIDGAKYAEPSWTPDASGFYYTRLPVDPTIPIADRPGYAEIRFHTLGADPATDSLIHERTGDPRTFIGADLARDGSFLFVTIFHGWNATDVWARDLRGNPTLKAPSTGKAAPAGKPLRGKAAKPAVSASARSGFVPLAVGLPARFDFEAHHGRLYVNTNHDAPRGRLFVVDPAKPARADWKEIVPQSPDSAPATLEAAQILGGHLVLTWLKNASGHLEVRSLDGKPVRDVALPAVGAVQGMTGTADDDTAYYAFHSFTVPLEVHRVSLKSGADTVWFKVSLPIDPSRFTVEQVFYPSRDGTRVSMFIVRAAGAPRDGSTPFLLSGYGGFNVSMLPGFASSLYPWLEAGGGYAMPNLRGGGEYGEEWHKAGMRGQKQNVFDDFIGAAEYLVKEGYTRPERLGISGRSNGGLLVGAALTQRPDLFRAVICGVPLLDMVRYHLHGSGKTWIEEYGSSEDEQGFRWLYAYSPYHHVQPGLRYPSVLFQAADHDDRVDPLHARKMAALLQSAAAGLASGARPVLLRIEKNAGHGGADLVKQAVERSTDAYSFLMNELGLPPPK